jgi:polyphosphate kinase 2 (PPK2 family)
MKTLKRASGESQADGAGKLRPISARMSKSSGAVVVTPGAKIKLSRVDPGAKPALSRDEAEAEVEALRERLLELQQALYAEHARSLLIVIQAMDTGGKMARSRRSAAGSTRTACT